MAATVVAPEPPRLTRVATSRTLTLTTSSRLATWSSASSSRPIRTRPSRMAIVAGTAPRDRTMSSTSVATRRFSGRGSPWLMMVDSRATTAVPAASASATSSVIWTRLGSRGCRGPMRGGAVVVTAPTLPAAGPASQPPGSPPGGPADHNGVRVGSGLPAGLGGRCPAAGRPSDPPAAHHPGRRRRPARLPRGAVRPHGLLPLLLGQAGADGRRRRVLHPRRPRVARRAPGAGSRRHHRGRTLRRAGRRAGGGGLPDP